MRALLKRPSRLPLMVEDDLGTFVDADAPLVVTVKDVDGTTVASGASTREDTGKYTYAFSRPTMSAPLVAEGVGAVGGLEYVTTEVIRVVDRYSVPLSTIRRDPALKDFPAEDVRQALQDAEDAIEAALRFRLVTTMDRITVQISKPQRVLRLPGPNYIQRVLRASRVPAGGAPVQIDPAGIAVRGDALELPTAASWDFLTGGASTATWLPGAYTFDLVHGLTETPGDLQNAVRMLARHYANQGVDQRYPDRTAKIVSMESEIWFSRIGESDWFGIPEVDAVIRQRRMDLPIADNSTF